MIPREIVSGETTTLILSTANIRMRAASSYLLSLVTRWWIEAIRTLQNQKLSHFYEHVLLTGDPSAQTEGEALVAFVHDSSAGCVGTTGMSFVLNMLSGSTAATCETTNDKWRNAADRPGNHWPTYQSGASGRRSHYERNNRHTN